MQTLIFSLMPRKITQFNIMKLGPKFPSHYAYKQSQCRRGNFLPNSQNQVVFETELVNLILARSWIRTTISRQESSSDPSRTSLGRTSLGRTLAENRTFDSTFLSSNLHNLRPNRCFPEANRPISPKSLLDFPSKSFDRRKSGNLNRAIPSPFLFHLTPWSPPVQSPPLSSC